MWLPPRVNLTDTLFPYTSRFRSVARGHAEPAAERLAEGGQVAIAATQRDLADVERGFAQQPAGVVEPDLADIVADREAAPLEHPIESPALAADHARDRPGAQARQDPVCVDLAARGGEHGVVGRAVLWPDQAGRQDE